MRSIQANWPVIFRAFLYFCISFLGTISDKVVSILEMDVWPTPQRWVLALIVGGFTGLVALRAFYDGTAQRHQDRNGGVATPG